MPSKRKLKALKVTALKEGDFPLLKNSQAVFEYTKEAVSNFYKIFQIIRGGSAGTTTHNEQDLLRAMLVFACSGLDAVAKQLVKDSLQRIIELDKTGNAARQEFQKFVERSIKKGPSFEADGKATSINAGFVAHILISDNPQIELIKSLQKDLCSNSLQSQDQLLKVAGYFAITKDQILNEPEITQKAFDIRNDIIHLMDVDLNARSQGRKNRKVRGERDMVKYTKNILDIGSRFINVVADKL